MFDYTSAIYIGAALTLITVFMLVFIDEDETDRILEEGDSVGFDEPISASTDSFEVTGDEQPYVAV